MSLLFPLYALGALAISLPLIFHLIQRRPQGQMPFSSLMFLSPSPPRMTRRSRLDNLLLLFLRGLALLLLSLAFARPFLRSVASLNLQPPARRIVLAVDTSASMQRDGLWAQAIEHADSLLNDIQPTDQFALVTFAGETETVVSFDAWQETDMARRPALVRDALKQIKPAWGATDLGRSLVVACDVLQNARESSTSEESLPPRIVLITDLQRGSRLAALEAYEWPSNVQVDLRTVRPTEPTNAAASVLSLAADEVAEDDQLRVRVRNAADSQRAQFQLQWVREGGMASRDVAVHVPPGQSRVVRLDRPASGTPRLVLKGDEHAFDNTVFVATRTPLQKRLLFVGPSQGDRESLLYYLRKASFDTPSQTVTIEQHDPAAPLSGLNPRDTPLVIVGAAVPLAQVNALRDYMQNRGRVLVVLDAFVATDELAVTCWRQLLSLEDLAIQEAEIRDYAMLSQIDFQHPLFQPFADPRFSDFTKIRFWKHRELLYSHEQPWRVVAKFDDQMPALVEQDHGDGKLWLLTSGWQPSESQLAVSSKFVPLLAGMLDPRGGKSVLEESYVVGQSVVLPRWGELTVIRKPDGETVSIGREAASFDDTMVPGVYAYLKDGEQQSFSVNLDAEESRTEPLAPEQLEQRGVKLGKQQTMAEIVDQQRQMRDMELESRQKLWRWVIAGVLVVLAAETWIAGRSSRVNRPEQ